MVVHDRRLALVRLGSSLELRCLRSATTSHAVSRSPLVLRNITITGGAAPARAYIEELLPDVLDGRIEPGRVFDRTVSLDQVGARRYRAMADREALKVLIQP